jgi:hypothetical protein
MGRSKCYCNESRIRLSMDRGRPQPGLQAMELSGVYMRLICYEAVHNGELTFLHIAIVCCTPLGVTPTQCGWSGLSPVYKLFETTAGALLRWEHRLAVTVAYQR